jgi:hypothetical protein
MPPYNIIAVYGNRVIGNLGVFVETPAGDKLQRMKPTGARPRKMLLGYLFCYPTVTRRNPIARNPGVVLVSYSAEKTQHTSTRQSTLEAGQSPT